MEKKPKVLSLGYAEQIWRQYLVRYDNYEHGDCHCCYEEMYPKRTVYTKAWLRLYVENENRISYGDAQMPQLLWRCARSASSQTIAQFHTKHCEIPLESCTCDLARLLFTLSKPMEMGRANNEYRSLEQIVPLWKQVKNSPRKK